MPLWSALSDSGTKQLLEKQKMNCKNNLVAVIKSQQEILLDCDQSNVLLVCTIFSCTLPSAFSFLSTCIRDPVSIWDRTDIILIVTGIEVVIGNCLPPAIGSRYCTRHRAGARAPKILRASTATVYLAQLWRYGASKIMGSRPWPFGVSWRHRSRDHSTPGGRLSMGGP